MGRPTKKQDNVEHSGRRSDSPYIIDIYTYTRYMFAIPGQHTYVDLLYVAQKARLSPVTIGVALLSSKFPP